MVTAYFHPGTILLKNDWRLENLSITNQGSLNFASKNDLKTNNIHALHAIKIFMTMPAYDKHMKEVHD